MPPQSTVLLILFLACVLYSIVLELLHDRYVPRWIWLTVVIGNGMIWGALALIEHYGTPLTALIVLQTFGAAGAPIIGWQLWQNWKRSQEMRD